MDDLKDENEQYRKMVLETIEKVRHFLPYSVLIFLVSLLFCSHTSVFFSTTWPLHANICQFPFKIMANLGAADIDSRLEEQLIDGILYAFQEQTNEV